MPFIQHKTIITYGIGESALAEKLETWEEELPAILSLAYLPSPGKVKLRLSGKHNDKQALDEVIEAEVSKLQNHLGELIVGYEDDESIVELIASLLKINNKTLAVAESCTGGYLTSMLTEKSGASAFFVASIVAYTKNVKINELGVLPSTIEKYSVVSTQVAEEMALGMLKKSEVDFAIATTGNAGPTTDETDKSVGVVCIAIASDSRVYSEEFNFGKPREKVIHRSSNKALELLRKEILKNY